MRQKHALYQMGKRTLVGALFALAYVPVIAQQFNLNAPLLIETAAPWMGSKG